MSFVDALRRAKSQRRGRGPVAISGTLDVDPEALLESCAAPWCFWDDGTETTLGLGAWVTLDGTGEDRFEAIERIGDALLGSIRLVGEAMRPRVFGGFAFRAGEHGPFAVFGDAHFVLPRLTLTKRGSEVVALLIADESELENTDAVLAATAALCERRVSSPAPAESSVVYDGSGEYLHSVERALAAIARHRVEKVVTSRVARVVTTTTPGRALSALRGTPHTTRFGLSTKAGTFVAATPELLCEVTESRLRTEAIAGTIAADGTAEELSNSDKNRREHAHVVHGVIAELARLGVAAPELGPTRARRLSHVQHLVTPIEVARPSGVHVIDVVRALHPTPAVGGFPRFQALELLSELEANGRGLYAAPCGWFDADGNGAFVVGIRSALFQGQYACVFAGGGIVEGSVPDRELDETDLKLRTLFSALGAVA